MHITAKDFKDNPHLTPIQIIRKSEDDMYLKAKKNQAKKRKERDELKQISEPNLWDSDQKI
jgi:uncharacterized protein YjiS (DUF1127 family)